MIETIVVVFLCVSSPIIATAVSNRRHNKADRIGGLKHYRNNHLNIKNNSMKKIIVNIGDRYNSLTIIREVEQLLNRRTFLCKCNCGKITKVRLKDLRSGHIKSCGCSRITHGLTETNIYKVFQGIKQRCINTKHKHYHRYGGRGIKCKWNSFEEFYIDMGDTYQDGLTIERNKLDGNYCKSNCEWATRKEQSKNRVDNIIYKGKCLSEWAEIKGINPSTLYARYNKLNWTIEDTVNKRVRLGVHS